jgi:hypothetical protein
MSTAKAKQSANVLAPPAKVYDFIAEATRNQFHSWSFAYPQRETRDHTAGSNMGIRV